jgi:hypothetical protein
MSFSIPPWGQSATATLLSIALAGAAEPPAAEQVSGDAPYRSAFDAYSRYDAQAPVLPWREVNDRASANSNHGSHEADGAGAQPAPPAASSPAESTHSHSRHTHAAPESASALGDADSSRGGASGPKSDAGHHEPGQESTSQGEHSRGSEPTPSTASDRRHRGSGGDEHRDHRP